MGCGVFLLAIEYAGKIKGRPRISPIGEMQGRPV